MFCSNVNIYFSIFFSNEGVLFNHMIISELECAISSSLFFSLLGYLCRSCKFFLPSLKIGMSALSECMSFCMFVTNTIKFWYFINYILGDWNAAASYSSDWSNFQILWAKAWTSCEDNQAKWNYWPICHLPICCISIYILVTA